MVEHEPLVGRSGPLVVDYRRAHRRALPPRRYALPPRRYALPLRPGGRREFCDDEQRPGVCDDAQPGPHASPPADFPSGDSGPGVTDAVVDPFHGYLTGAADVIRAQATYMVSAQ